MNPALLRTLAIRQAYSNSKSPAAKADSYDFLMDNPRGRVSRPLPFPGYICRRAFLRKQQNPSSSDLRCHCQPGLLGRPLPFHACRIPRPSISFPTVARLICFLLLVCMGTLRILDQAIKSFLCRHDGFSRNFMFRALHFQFFLSVYADPCKADADASKSLSVPESVCLAFAMSLDGAAAGFGAALGNLNPVAVLFFSLLFGFTAIQGGFLLGNRLAQKTHFSVDWLSGALLILLAFLRLT